MEKRDFKENILNSLRYDVFTILEESFNKLIEFKPISSISNYPDISFTKELRKLPPVDLTVYKKRFKKWDEQMNNLIGI